MGWGWGCGCGEQINDRVCVWTRVLIRFLQLPRHLRITEVLFVAAQGTKNTKMRNGQKKTLKVIRMGRQSGLNDEALVDRLACMY